MTDTTEKTAEKAEAAQSNVDFAALIGKAKMPGTDLPYPEAVTGNIVKALDELYRLVVTHNSRVLRIQQAQTKEKNASDDEFLNRLWASKVAAGTATAEIAEKEKRYQELNEEILKIGDELRAWAKTQIEPPLSETELTNERKLANETVPLINDGKQRAEALASMADQLLELSGAKPEGGIMALIPAVESMKGRGRKSGTSSGTTGTSYRFRYGTIKLDGKAISRERKVRGEMTTVSDLIIAAEELNREWGTDAITEEALETAMYLSQGVTGTIPEMRGRKDELKDEFDFEFSTEIAVQNKNDDSTHNEPRKVKVTVIKNTRDDQRTETKADEKPAENATENAEPVKQESAAENAPIEAKPEAAKPETDKPNVGPRTAALKAKQEAMQKAQEKK